MVKIMRRNEREEKKALLAAAKDARSIVQIENDVDIYEDDVVDCRFALDAAEENLDEARARLKAAKALRDSDQPLPEPEMVIPDCQFRFI